MNINQRHKNIPAEFQSSWNTSIDLVRLFALFLVVSTHFFLWTGFYSTPLNCSRMSLAILIRVISTSCVPLFLIISGYVLSKKDLSFRSFKGILKILFFYIVCGLLCYWFCIIAKNYIPDIPKYQGIRSVALAFLSFNIAPYGWYIGMYIGLFFFAPFLNALFNALKTQKNKLILCLVLIIFTSLPTLTNSINITQSNLFDMIFNGSGKFSILIYDIWTPLYPITYYFIGSYLKEYPLRIKKSLNLILILIAWLVFAAYTYISYSPNVFVIYQLQSSWGFFTLIISSLIFNFFISFSTKNIPILIKRFIKKCASCVLCAYLLSYIFDISIYTYLNSFYINFTDKIIYYPICVVSSFVLSLLLSGLVNFIYNIIKKAAICICAYIKRW